jgi:predicted ester cyclase
MTDRAKTEQILMTLQTYTQAMTDADAAGLHRLRTDNFSLDFVHGDAFEDRPLTREETKQFWPAWFAAFSEMDYEITRTIAAPEVAVIQWVFTGKHCCELGEPVFNRSIPPTGRTIRLRGISVLDFNGKAIQKETVYIDQATLLLELDAGYE